MSATPHRPGHPGHQPQTRTNLGTICLCTSRITGATSAAIAARTRISSGAFNHAWATFATIEMPVATISHARKKCSACFAAAAASASTKSSSRRVCRPRRRRPGLLSALGAEGVAVGDAAGVIAASGLAVRCECTTDPLRVGASSITVMGIDLPEEERARVQLRSTDRGCE